MEIASWTTVGTWEQSLLAISGHPHWRHIYAMWPKPGSTHGVRPRPVLIASPHPTGYSSIWVAQYPASSVQPKVINQACWVLELLLHTEPAQASKGRLPLNNIYPHAPNYPSKVMPRLLIGFIMQLFSDLSAKLEICIFQNII